MEDQGINRSRLFYGDNWPTEPAIPDQLSSAEWALDVTQDPLNPNANSKLVRPFVQQTFLGCSVIDFNVNGGFGDSSSLLHVSLVQDEYNKSDGLPLGVGDDPYHNGKNDLFRAPPVGSPVFFKFGPNHATIPQVWIKTFDNIYGYNTLPLINPVTSRNVQNLTTLKEGEEFVNLDRSDVINERNYSVYDYGNLNDLNNNARGLEHFNFGGILQNYTQDSSDGGDPKYSVSVADPREILSNTTMILNNYSNSIFNLPNLFNVFGFLEYNPSKSLRESIDSYYGSNKFLFKKIVNQDGTVTYRGGYDVSRNISYPMFTDAYATDSILSYLALSNADPARNTPPALGNFPNVFPYTGTSYSRRTDRGIPMYRVVQAMNAMMGFHGELPQEYNEKGFGKFINFRGFNYVVDFGGLPIGKVPPSYSLDFDQMNLLEFCQEVCDVTSHDFFVSLLPVIDHPASYNIHQYNQAMINQNRNSEIVVGIIRIDSIDRSKKPNYGAISNFINILKARGSEILSSREGFELSNVPTDKFVVGAQEVEMHFFTNNGDRDFLDVRKSKNGVANRVNLQLTEQWYISNSLRQQIIPFYGFLGKDCVTIPRGYGSFQQILLDSSNLNANGVGNYYVATELELRAAAVSYESWKDFLMQYNDLYMQPLNNDTAIEGSGLVATVPPELAAMNSQYITSKKYAVTVPRCVFRSDENYIHPNGTPASPCSPPFGYPLYYKRATSIGIPEGGILGFTAARTNLAVDLAKFKNKDDKNYIKLVNSAWEQLVKDSEQIGADPAQKQIVNYIKQELARPGNVDTVVTLLDKVVSREKVLYQDIAKTAEQQNENALKVYEFVKAAASNLGTKYLVKIPKETNPFFSQQLGLVNFGVGVGAASENIFQIEKGPFGFQPRLISTNIDYRTEDDFQRKIRLLQGIPILGVESIFRTILGYGTKTTGLSTLDRSFNSITELFSANNPFNFDLTYGALKSEYDSVSNSHIFNYEPEPQGGFFNFDLYKNMLSLKELNQLNPNVRPFLIKSMLFPVDPTNFMKDNRISSYVRFDNSEYLDFSSVPSDAFFQMAITDVGLLPDVLLELENTSEDRFTKFSVDSEEQKALDKKMKSCAFLRCDLDGKFYMPPKLKVLSDSVYGTEVIQKHNIKSGERTWNPETGETVFSLPVYEANFVPARGGRGNVLQEDFDRESICQDGMIAVKPLVVDPVTAERTDARGVLVIGDIIKTDVENQDSDHVYALITLPGVIRSKIDQRFSQGMFNTSEAATISHILTQDVVKYVPGFESPPYMIGPDIKLPLNKDNVNQEASAFSKEDGAVSSADFAYRAALKKSQYSMNNVLNISMPSPASPDLVALPLMSRERCYGPWISSFSDIESIRYKNIPGKVEFIKDESLSPWNYNGYDLMNEAGYLQAEFSNSLMLFSENGEISFVGLPNGNSLLNPIAVGGPLVTSISINVDSSAGVTTSYSMATYTPRFGNLKKQKSDLISKISRERQRFIDEKNTLIRKGLNKTANIDYESRNQKYSSAENISRVVGDLQNYTEMMQRSSEITSTVVTSSETYIDPSTNRPINHITNSSNNSIQSDAKKTISLATDAREQINKALSTTFGAIWEGISKEQNSFIPNMQPPKETPIEDIKDLL